MMARLEAGTVGILPAGALGVGFFYHLTSGLRSVDGKVCFMERRGSPSGAAIRTGGILRIATDGAASQELPATRLCKADLLDCARRGWIPEFLLICTQPDQLSAIITEFVELLEWLTADEGLEAAIPQLPILLLCSNGIYHQRVRRFLVESLEESMLYGRLPDLWNSSMSRIVGKLLRGVTIQTGSREGQGEHTIYYPGPPGRVLIAGGDPVIRKRCRDWLESQGKELEITETETATRAEFDKALVNLCGNVLGLLKAVDADGDFRALTVREIFPAPESIDTHELATHVIAVGRAVNAYQSVDNFDDLYWSAMRAARGPLDHVPSSIQQVKSRLEAGNLIASLSATEHWLIDPLIHYASTVGLEDSARYFSELVARVERSLARAMAFRAAATHET